MKERESGKFSSIDVSDAINVDVSFELVSDNSIAITDICIVTIAYMLTINDFLVKKLLVFILFYSGTT